AARPGRFGSGQRVAGADRPGARVESSSQEIVMRASHLVLSLLGAGVLGCGGGNSSAPDAPVDAFARAQSGAVNATAPLDFSQGGQAQGAVPAGETQLR